MQSHVKSICWTLNSLQWTVETINSTWFCNIIKVNSFFQMISEIIQIRRAAVALEAALFVSYFKTRI